MTMKPLAWLLMLAALIAPALAHAQTNPPTMKVTRQPSIIYMPTYVMEQQKLVEKRAAALGVPGLAVEWITFSGGGNATDAMLAGSIDVINSGPGNMLLLWDRTRGGVKGIIATSALPLILVSRDPRIKSLDDFKEADKIAVPTVRVSTQAVLLQMAAAAQYGPAQWNKFDGNTVQMSHPDASVALLNPRHEVASHFSAPPFVFQTLKNVPGAHVVTDTNKIMGSPLTNGMFFATTKFADANPKLIQALKEATL
ncbi:MAG: ABC transporter substrate-binding protein, partial [Gemmatimonadaceae bacterium]|nr:ABC transporter substrate-binding protein [Acetobacteraceae bacterium]